VGSAVDEIRECDEGGGETDCGAVEGGYEDFGVRVEGVGYVEVVGYEVFDPVALDVSFRLIASCCYVGASDMC
jgi:hypothetical protein